MAKLIATPNLRGGRIDLRFSVPRQEHGWPAVTLLRRRGAFPAHSTDGLRVLDFSELRDANGRFWERIHRRRFIATNSPRDGGLTVLELTEYFTQQGDELPARVRLCGPEPERRKERFGSSTRVERDVSDERAQHILFEDTLGTQGELHFQEDADGSGRVTWRGRARAFINAPYHARLDDSMEIRKHTIDGRLVHRLTVRRRGAWAPVLEAHLIEHVDRDRNQHSFELQVTDATPALSPPTSSDLEAGIYYYRLFGEGIDPAKERASEYRAISIAIGRYGFSRDRSRPTQAQHRLYQLLPAVLQRLDEPEPGAGPGQLRSFMEIFGAGFDALRSSAELLGHRHDLREARADRLEHLARYIGWPLDHTKDATTQRFDVAAAPRVYRSVGTAANLKALINRATGREVEVKEYIHNVAFTNAIEPIRTWDVVEGQVTPNSTGSLTWSELTHTNVETGVHGRPSLVTLADGSTVTAWQARDDDVWRIYLRRGSGSVQRLELPSDVDTKGVFGEVEPCLVAAPGTDQFLVFSVFQVSATRSALLVRRLDPHLRFVGRPHWLTPGPATRDFAATLERLPAAVSDSAHVWLFWQSDRSGDTSLWHAQLEGGDPENWVLYPQLLSKPAEQDEMPTVTRDEAPAVTRDPGVLPDASDARIWLVWSRDEGSRSSLWQRSFTAGTWSAPQPIPSSLTESGAPGNWRDRSPSLAFSLADRHLHLVWQSDRPQDGIRRSRLWYSMSDHDGVNWTTPPTVLTDSATADEEPSFSVETGGALRLTWSTQRYGKGAWTRTLDTRDSSLLAHLGHVEDRVHYTYDTRRHENPAQETARYAGDIVGLFFPASDEDATTVRREIERMKSFVEPFRPAHVRFVWEMPRRIRTVESGARATDEASEMHLAWIHTVDTNPPPPPRFTDHKTVDTTADPLDLHLRIVDADVERMSRS